MYAAPDIVGDYSDDDGAVAAAVEIAGDDDDEPIPPLGRRRRAIPQTIGEPTVFLVLAPRAGGLWHAAFRRELWLPLPDGLGEYPLLMGAVVARWRLVEANAEAGDNTHILSRHMMKAALRKYGMGKAFRGWLVYEILERFAADAPVHVESRDVATLLRVIADRCPSLHQKLLGWSARVAGQPIPLWIAPRLARAVVQDCWSCLHALAFRTRLPSRQGLGAEPTALIVRRFREGKPLHIVNLNDDVSMLRRAPRKRWKSQHSATNVVKWVRATRYVSNLSNAMEACKAFGEILLTRRKLERAMLRSSVVCRTVIRMARVRLDCVSMLVHRCWLAGLRETGTFGCNNRGFLWGVNKPY